MKLFNLPFLGIVVCFLIISCNKDDGNCVDNPPVSNGVCIDSTLINDSIFCIEIYDPVCGCDGITYGNYCHADRSGVTSYLPGECCD